MNETTTRGFEPHWQQCLGSARCEDCGKLSETTWRWFAEVATWTRCYCESCVEALLAEHEPAD
jgi:hypothetical protein